MTRAEAVGLFIEISKKRHTLGTCVFVSLEEVKKILLEQSVEDKESHLRLKNNALKPLKKKTSMISYMLKLYKKLKTLLNKFGKGN